LNLLFVFLQNTCMGKTRKIRKIQRIFFWYWGVERRWI